MVPSSLHFHPPLVSTQPRDSGKTNSCAQSSLPLISTCHTNTTMASSEQARRDCLKLLLDGSMSSPSPPSQLLTLTLEDVLPVLPLVE